MTAPAPLFTPWFWSNLAIAPVIEVLESAGASTIIVDLQHGESVLADVIGAARAARSSRIVPRVRLNEHPDTIARLLDAGLSTLMFPQVDTATQAAELVRMTHYPPGGTRGVAGSHRANDYGQDREYFHRANASVCRIMQLETSASIAAAAAIAAVDGVDGLFVGTSDLAADLGHIGNPGAQPVLDSLSQVAEACRHAQLAIGLGAFCGINDVLTSHAARNKYNFLVVGSDLGLLASAVRRRLESLA